MAMKPDHPQPYIFVPKQGEARLLFVLLHGESAKPDQLFPLAQAIKLAFPSAVVVLPFAYAHSSGPGESSPMLYSWIEPGSEHEQSYAGRVKQGLPELIELVKSLQAQYGLSGEETALAGYSQGACMALEASLAQPDLAGRVLAFSGLYARQPDAAPPATLLHFFHGADDTQVLAHDVASTLARLEELQGDATLDVASDIGHELHEALIQQAIVRLQTCVPLRNWQAALALLQQQAQESEEQCQLPDRPGRTLH